MTWARWPNTEWKNNWRTNQKWESVTYAGPGTESDGTGFVTADFADVANNLIGKRSYQIDMTGYSTGLYFISTQAITGALKSYKVLVQ